MCIVPISLNRLGGGLSFHFNQAVVKAAQKDTG